MAGTATDGGGATACAGFGSPTTCDDPSGAITSTAGSPAGTMPWARAAAASAGADCAASTSRCRRSLCSERSRATWRASSSRYESAAAAVESHSVATSPR